MHSRTRHPSRRPATSPLLRAISARLQPGVDARRLVLLRGYCALDALSNGHSAPYAWRNLHHVLTTVSMLCTQGHESASALFIEDCLQHVHDLCQASPSALCTDQQTYAQLCACMATLERQLLTASEHELRLAAGGRLPAMSGWNQADRLRAHWIWGMSEAFGTRRMTDKAREHAARSLVSSMPRAT